MQQEGLQGNWALVVAYRQAPKLADGRLAFRENKKLMAEFNKTEKQVRRIIQLVRSADRQGIYPMGDNTTKGGLLGSPQRLKLQ